MANSKKRCKQCKEYVLVETGVQTNQGFFCTGKHIIEFMNKKKEADHKKETREKKNAFYDNDRSYQLSLTQPVFNRMRVMQELLWFHDKGLEPECISCGKTKMDWCCGHFKTVGSQANLRFDTKNTYLQCNRYCNKGLSGNIEGNKNTRGYKQGLIDRFGADEAAEINHYCESSLEPARFKPDQLIKMRAEFAGEYRRLKALYATKV